MCDAVTGRIPIEVLKSHENKRSSQSNMKSNDDMVL